MATATSARRDDGAEDADQRLVSTPYGRGLVVRTEWRSFARTTSGDGDGDDRGERDGASHPSSSNGTKSSAGEYTGGTTSGLIGSIRATQKHEQKRRRGNEHHCPTGGDRVVTQAVQLLEWDMTTSTGNTTRSRRRKNSSPHPILHTSSHLPTVEPRIGDDVICLYGRGVLGDIVVVEASVTGEKGSSGEGASSVAADVDKKNAIEFVDGGGDDEKKDDCSNPAPTPAASSPTEAQRTFAALSRGKKGRARLRYVVRLTSWRLADRSTVTCHLSRSDVHVVRKKTLGEMNVRERVDYAASRKSLASQSFQSKQYQKALELYASAVDAVRYVQHDTRSDNVLRADLVEIMIACSNNAATCCAKIGGDRWNETSRFANNALVLLEALYEKRGMKIHGVLNVGGLTDAKLFGEWRVKSHLLIARAEAEEGEYGAAVKTLKKAEEALAEYHGPTDGGKAPPSDEAQASRLAAQDREVRRLKAACGQRLKAERKKERQRAQAMFGSASPRRKAPVAAAAAATVDAGGTAAAADGASPAPAAAGPSTSRGGGAGEEEASKVADGRAAARAVPPPLPTPPRTYDGGPRQKKTVKFDVADGEGGIDVGGISGVGRDDREEEDDDGEEGDCEVPWYDEHKEALVLAGVGGLLACSFALLRGMSSPRR